MAKPGVINKKRNATAGYHKSRARRAIKGRAPELVATKAMSEPQRKKRLTNPVANVNFSKKKLRLLNKGKRKDEEMDDADGTSTGCGGGRPGGMACVGVCGWVGLWGWVDEFGRGGGGGCSCARLTCAHV